MLSEVKRFRNKRLHNLSGIDGNFFTLRRFHAGKAGSLDSPVCVCPHNNRKKTDQKLM